MESPSDPSPDLLHAFCKPSPTRTLRVASQLAERLGSIPQQTTEVKLIPVEEVIAESQAALNEHAEHVALRRADGLAANEATFLLGLRNLSES